VLEQCSNTYLEKVLDTSVRTPQSGVSPTVLTLF
jgi:hypothetical protein